MSDVKRRLRRIFQNDGKAFVVACDHGMINGPMEGIENLGDVLLQVIAGGADGIMATYGTAVRFGETLAGTGLVLRIDGAASIQCPVEGSGDAFYSVEDALRVGAEALCVTTFTWTKWEEHMLQVLARIIRDAHTWGIPVMAEMMPGGFGAGAEFRSTEAIAHAARVAAELGADWVKVPYCENFSHVVKTCYVPVVVLGGPNDPDKRKTLEMVKKGLDAGAMGATIGRNVWQSPNTEKMARAVSSLIHKGVTVDEAVAGL